MFRFLKPKPDPPFEPELDPAEIVRKARRLQFRTRPTALAQLSGAYLGARPGTGLTFAELRAYEPGDDVRHLDWNVTARQGRPFVRRYTEERALNLHLLVDVSASLRFGPDGESKADRAAQTAALLAAAAIQNGDRVSLTLVTDRIEAELPPGGGSRHLTRLLRMLVATPARSARTALTEGLKRPRRFARRGLVAVISDFLSKEPVGPWRRIAARSEVVAVRIVEPREEHLPQAGLLALEDAETGRQRRVNTGSKRVRRAYERLASERRKSFRSWCSAVGISSLELSTEDDPLGPLLRYFRARADRLKGPR